MATAATPTPFVAHKMPSQQALVLSAQINDGEDAEALTRVGFPHPLAIELAAQIGGEAGNIPRLVASGLHPLLAKAVSDSIDAAFAE